MSATLASAVLATTMRLVASPAYAEGAPPGFSGGFKEESCHACHFHAEPNSGPGRVAIEGLPARFVAGERYTLIVTLTRTGMKRAGFQLTARFKDGGAQAGALAPGPDERERVGVVIQSGVEYAGQKKEGSSVGVADAVRWTIQWTAPAAGGGPVVFNVAANAADGNESADGDFVYTTSAESAPPGAPARRLAPRGSSV
ncbi:MAG: choice-of-anchor V domain-containing protein [Vicinamibacterales bacterium]